MRTEMKRKYLFFALVIILSSCLNDDSGDTINTKGLQEIHGTFNNLLFINKQDGFLFGYRSGDPEWRVGGELARIDTPAIFRTTDGGKTWKNSFSGKDIIKNISLSDGEIYGEKSTKELNEAATIYKLNRVTSKWEEYSKINGYIRNFQVFNNGFGIVCLKNDNDLFSTKDKGKTWYKLPQLARVDQIIIRKNSVNYIGTSTTDTAPFSTLFAEYDLETKKSSTISFPKGFRAYCIDEYNGEFFFSWRSTGYSRAI